MSKPQLQTARPYGFAAYVERNVPYSADPVSGLGAKVETIRLRRKGPLRVVERAAGLTSGFIRIVSVEPFTQEQWERCFGVGRS